MKVNNQMPSGAQILDTKNTEKAGALGNQKKTDSVGAQRASTDSSSMIEISDNAKLMKRATEIVMQSPDVRADRVASLKKSIQDGSYKVDSAKIADRLVDEHLATDLGRNNI